MWLTPVLLVPEFSKFEKSNVNFSKEESSQTAAKTHPFKASALK